MTDLLHFDDSGMVRVGLGDGSLVWLRRPRLGELRTVRYAHLAMAIDLEHLPPDVEVREDRIVAFWEQVIGLVALTPPPRVMEPELWMVDPGVPTAVIDHWRHTPIGPWKHPDDRRGDDGPVGTPEWAVGTIEDEFTPIYLALARLTDRHGPIAPTEADGLDLTTIAGLMGVNAGDEFTVNEDGVPSWWNDDGGVADEMLLVAQQLGAV